jgi:hypothetical protein
MYQLPELAKAISNDKLRAANDRRLCTQAYAARGDGTRRGIALLAALRLRLARVPRRSGTQRACRCAPRSAC